MIDIRRISITELDTDAIVNAANERLAAGGGVCGAIFRAAGHDELQRACDKYGHCDTGKAVITPGFRLRAKYVIHAVGPIYRGGQYGEEEKLKSAYKSSLELASANGCNSIGFPLISAGIYGYPVEAAWEAAISACDEYMRAHPEENTDIIFAVLDDRILEVGRKILRKGSSYQILETTPQLP